MSVDGKAALRGFVHDTPKFFILVRNVDLQTDVRRHVLVVRVVLDPRPWIRLGKLSQSGTYYTRTRSVLITYINLGGKRTQDDMVFGTSQLCRRGSCGIIGA